MIDEEKIIKFIKDYVKSANKKEVVLGLSGGIDSAVIAVLSKKALGTKNVHCVYLPDNIKPTSWDFDKEHIDKLCKRFDLTYESFEIDSLVKIYKQKIPIINDNLGLGNVKARIRMNVLYSIARKKNSLVIGTTNKTELLLGYYTKYGDGGVDFEPIAHLYKTEIFDLAKQLDIPNEIIDKKPSAGLWKDQTDEDEIGLKYKDIDKILNLPLISAEETSKKTGIKKENVKMIFKMIQCSVHKRKTPPTIEDWYD